jgi:hypothetical protein
MKKKVKVIPRRSRIPKIIEQFGYWTTIPSAITCWATILDN